MRLAREYGLALRGEAWHGPSWREVLEGVGHAAALAKPIQGAHGIAEIVLHLTAWHEIVRLRLAGESPDVSNEMDWPEVRVPDEEAWQALCRRSMDAGQALEAAVAEFPPDRLHEQRPGLDATWFGLISGQLQHVSYHTGQIALLRKGRS